MGLDMYLYKKHYVKHWSHQDKAERKVVTVKREGKKYPFIDAKKVSYIQEELGYWRKANAIHNWFVQNCQNGMDECQEAYVDPSKLQELLDICKQVKAGSILVKGKVSAGYSFDKAGKKVHNMVDGETIEDTSVAEALLPGQEGFFFGGTEYDDWYLQGINDTIKMLEEELAIDYGRDQPEYYYRSSW